MVGFLLQNLLAKTLTDFRRRKYKFFFNDFEVTLGIEYNGKKKFRNGIVMQRYYLDYSLNAASEMVNSYYVDKNIKGVFKHIYKGNFSWMGYDYDLFFNDADEFRKFAESKLEFLSSYELIKEDYSVISEAQESCIVIAQIKLLETRMQKDFDLNIFFYFCQLGKSVICQHYHVVRPPRIKTENKSIFFSEIAPKSVLPNEIQAYNEELLNFINSNAAAEKSFYFAENFPYRFVNYRYMQLLGYKKCGEFATDENSSVLSNIHVADQRQYAEYLRTKYESDVVKFRSGQQYQYRSSYCIKYRLQSPYLSEEVSVFEWGNFFTLNGRTIVNCLVFNLNELKDISSEKKIDTQTPNASVHEEFGIRIGEKIIAYPTSHKITIGEELVELTNLESEIFVLFIDKLNQPITAEEIYASIWKNDELKLTSNALQMHISNIRRKLNPYESLIRLVNVRNKGYCLQIGVCQNAQSRL